MRLSTVWTCGFAAESPRARGVDVGGDDCSRREDESEEHGAYIFGIDAAQRGHADADGDVGDHGGEDRPWKQLRDEQA